MENVRHVGWINQRVLTQVALALAALARQNMTAIGLLALDGTTAGYLEPLLSTTVSLHLWHVVLLTLLIQFLPLALSLRPLPQS